MSRGRLVIEQEFGIFYGKTSAGKVDQATSIEKLLVKLDPGAPEEKIAAAAEILEGLLPSETQGQIQEGVVS